MRHLGYLTSAVESLETRTVPGTEQPFKNISETHGERKGYLELSLPLAQSGQPLTSWMTEWMGRLAMTSHCHLNYGYMQHGGFILQKGL